MREIVQDGAPVLREEASLVPDETFGSAELTQLIKEMSEALDRELEGVALAAPQVGVSWRLFIVRKDRTLPLRARGRGGASTAMPAPEIEVYINPEVAKTSRRRAQADEGCLSIRGVYGTTKRH